MIRELFQALAALAAIGTAVLAVCPEGELKKYVKLCCALCAVALFSSLLPFSPSLSYDAGEKYEIADLSGETVKLVIEKTLSNVEIAVSDLAEQKYGISKDDMAVKAYADSSDTENVRLIKIECELHGLKNALFVTGLERYVEDRFGCVCEVIYEE